MQFPRYPYGQKYYNTLRIQSLAPADSISELFEIIYSFYKNNLESQYDSSDTAFEILTQNIQKRLSGSDDKDDAQIKFGSGFWALKSSLKFLLSHEPVYMAAVCDAVAGKMDMLLRGDSPALNTNNRWDSAPCTLSRSHIPHTPSRSGAVRRS